MLCRLSEEDLRKRSSCCMLICVVAGPTGKSGENASGIGSGAHKRGHECTCCFCRMCGAACTSNATSCCMPA
eukprot:2882874-Amphidinium_carterae.2